MMHFWKYSSHLCFEHHVTRNARLFFLSAVQCRATVHDTNCQNEHPYHTEIWTLHARNIFRGYINLSIYYMSQCQQVVTVNPAHARKKLTKLDIYIYIYIYIYVMCIMLQIDLWNTHNNWMNRHKDHLLWKWTRVGDGFYTFIITSRPEGLQSKFIVQKILEFEPRM